MSRPVVRTRAVGIEALGAYCGTAAIGVREMFEGRGLDARRFENLSMRQRSVQLPWEDPVTNAANAARPILDRLTEAQRAQIGLLIVSTESGLDFSKSLASYVHEHLGLSRNCRFFEVKQACYGATGALQLAAGYLSAGLRPGMKALVIATDVNPMDEHAQYAEPTTGHGAIALLVSEQPDVLELNLGAYGVYGFEAMDTARPRADFDLYNAELSLLTYLECLREAYNGYACDTGEVSFTESFDFLALHTPFAGMVKAAHRQLMRALAPGPPSRIAEDFARRVEPTLTYVRQVGNLCSGSLYLALAGLVDSVPAAEADGARVGMFSYGSGCCSEFFSGTLRGTAREKLADADIPGMLSRRRPLTFAQYAALVPGNRERLVPRSESRTDFGLWDAAETSTVLNRPQLVWTGTEQYHRAYEWR